MTENVAICNDGAQKRPDFSIESTFYDRFALKTTANTDLTGCPHYGCIYIREPVLRFTYRQLFFSPEGIKSLPMNMRPIIPFTIASALIIAMTHNPVGGQQTAVKLNDYLWKNRPLLLFAPAPTTPDYRRIASDIADQMAQILDRDMVIIAVFETGRVTVDDEPVSGMRADDLRREFGAPPEESSAMLIGKDGGLKLKQIGRFDLAEIFALIDSMPMRQREMRNKAQ